MTTQPNGRTKEENYCRKQILYTRIHYYWKSHFGDLNWDIANRRIGFLQENRVVRGQSSEKFTQDLHVK